MRVIKYYYEYMHLPFAADNFCVISGCEVAFVCPTAHDSARVVWPNTTKRIQHMTTVQLPVLDSIILMVNFCSLIGSNAEGVYHPHCPYLCLLHLLKIAQASHLFF